MPMLSWDVRSSTYIVTYSMTSSVPECTQHATFHNDNVAEVLCQLPCLILLMQSTPQLKIPHSIVSIAFRPYNSFTHSCNLTISNYRNMVQTNFQITLKIILKPPFIQVQLRELSLVRHVLELL